MKRYIALVLGVLIVLSLIATSFVSARPLADTMDSHFITIPEGSVNSSYNGDYITSSRTINLMSGWSENLPFNTCAVALRFAYKDNIVGHWGSLRSNSSGAHTMTAHIQAANTWSDVAGIVPLTGAGADMYLEISSPGYVDIELTGYWVCDDYIRPTLESQGP